MLLFSGQAFLKGTYHQDVPDIDSLTAKLAEQTRHPPPEVISPSETPEMQPSVNEVPSFFTGICRLSLYFNMLYFLDFV